MLSNPMTSITDKARLAFRLVSRLGFRQRGISPMIVQNNGVRQNHFASGGMVAIPRHDDITRSYSMRFCPFVMRRINVGSNPTSGSFLAFACIWVKLNARQ
jgi:hypothetical protein